jgi:DNA-binding transcriptional LysR family regulator
MELRHLRYFLAAVEEGSLQRAADRLNLAQPALSRRIRDLEDELRCKLFERTYKGVTPTEAGTAFYREMLALLNGLDQSVERIRRMGPTQGPKVRIGLVHIFRKYAFANDAIVAFRKQQPNVELSFMRDVSNIMSLALRERRLELAFLFEQNLSPLGFGQRSIHRERLVLGVHPQHRLAAAEPASLSDIAGTPLVWLSQSESDYYHAALAQQFRLQGVEPAIAHVAHNHEELIDLTMASGGVCVTVASSTLSTAPGALVFRPLVDLNFEVQLSLAWSPEIEPSSPAGQLLELLHAAIDRHQEAIRTGACAWARMLGEDVIRTD